MPNISLLFDWMDGAVTAAWHKIRLLDLQNWIHGQAKTHRFAMAAKSTTAAQPETSQNGKKNAKSEKFAAAKQDAEDEAEDEPVEKGAKGEASKDMKNVTRYFEEQAERNVDADKIQKVELTRFRRTNSPGRK